VYTYIYIDNYAPTGQKKLCFASRHPGKGGASKGFREAAAAAAALAANDEYIATVDGCKIHQLIGGKHPIILLGVQPSKKWCRISQPSIVCHLFLTLKEIARVCSCIWLFDSGYTMTPPFFVVVGIWWGMDGVYIERGSGISSTASHGMFRIGMIFGMNELPHLSQPQVIRPK